MSGWSRRARGVPLVLSMCCGLVVGSGCATPGRPAGGYAVTGGSRVVARAGGVATRSVRSVAVVLEALEPLPVEQRLRKQLVERIEAAGRVRVRPRREAEAVLSLNASLEAVQLRERRVVREPGNEGEERVEEASFAWTLAAGWRLTDAEGLAGEGSTLHTVRSTRGPRDARTPLALGFLIDLLLGEPSDLTALDVRDPPTALLRAAAQSLSAAALPPPPP